LSGGSGLLFLQLELYGKINKLDHVANDLRATRVWNLGSGKLTTTAGLYASQQACRCSPTSTIRWFPWRARPEAAIST
jgi:hypothetical protein